MMARKFLTKTLNRSRLQSNENKEHANWNLHIAPSSILLMQSANLYFFIKHFSTSPIVYEGSTLQFRFPHKGRLDTSQ